MKSAARVESCRMCKADVSLMDGEESVCACTEPGCAGWHPTKRQAALADLRRKRATMDAPGFRHECAAFVEALLAEEDGHPMLVAAEYRATCVGYGSGMATVQLPSMDGEWVFPADPCEFGDSLVWDPAAARYRRGAA